MTQGIARRMLARQRAGLAGNRKYTDATVWEFRRRIAAGETQKSAAASLGIKRSAASMMARRHTYPHVVLLVLLALGTMGAGPCNQNKYNVTCQGVNYPMCDNVPYDYPCLCLNGPDRLTSEAAESLRHVND